jgi:16S rRNA (adenine1518-N6/adenine1519-N6)-dimethyltransferase
MPETVAVPPTVRRRRKSLGQHFLADARIANRIVAAAEPDGSDTVLEIGPGAGVLTRRLVEPAGRVVAVELDQRLAEELPAKLGFPTNLEVKQGDGREVSVDELVGVGTPYKVVANLPYYAAAPIVRRFLETVRPPTVMVVMVQREVADAMNAKPGEFTLLSVATQFYAEPSVVAQVPPRCFRPPPKVSSTVLKLAVRPEPAAAVVDAGDFFALVRAGFNAPRKQLRNSLMQGTGASAETVTAALARAGIDSQRRPATLEIAEWAVLDAIWPAGVSRSRPA